MINFEEISEILHQIKGEIRQKFDRTFVKEKALNIQKKPDKTIVTDIDLYISDIIKNKFLSKYEFINFFSEEDMGEFKFPMIILDPIDGTRDLAKGVNECSVSFGIYFSPELNDERNFSWIYNPFNGFEISSISNGLAGNTLVDKKFLAFVSRTEFEANLHTSSEKISYFPKGSIAYKLGLLASGAGDFVISKKPKNIWDIMAGTHICYSRGIKLFNNGQQISSLDKKLLKNDLVWSHPNIWNEVKDSL